MSARSFLKPLLVVLATVGVILLGNRILFPPGGGYIVTAEFDDSAGLTKNSDVKIGGVAGGKVKDIELTERDTAKVTMELDEGAFPIGAGASAASRPVNLLGEKYVDMDAGDLKKPQPSGSSIPIDRTSRPVELDDVLNMLDPDVRARMRILINEAGIGMAGRKADFNEILEQLPPSLDRARDLVAQFSEDQETLGRLIERSDRVLASMGREDEDLGKLVDAAAGTFDTTVARRRELADTVRNAPATLRQLRTTLSDLSGTADELRPAAARLRKAAPELTKTLKELPGFAKAADPALDQITESSPDIAKLGRDGRSAVARLKPTSEELSRFATQMDPISKSFDEHGMQNFLGLVNGWARTIRRSDGLGHVFGLRVLIGADAVQHLLERYVDPVASKKKGGRQAPKPKGKIPLLQEKPSQPLKLPKVPEVVDKVKKTLDDVGKTVKGVTDELGKTVDGVTKGLDGVTKGLGDVTRGLGEGLKGGLLKKRGEAPRQSDASRLLDYLVGGQ